MSDARPSGEELFAAALELAPGERARLLDEQCAGRPEVRAEVESLLRMHDQAGEFLQTPAIAALIEPGPDEPELPERIGQYRILGVLGAGGMGMVYLAEGERPRREVALKVIRPGYLTPSVRRRFEFESETLARLQHPGIAQVYEAGLAGAHPDPQPYFAMELVRGLPLTRYCHEHALGTRERLGLVASVCDAVAHAHARGVIHRDLKPGNILVTEEGLPKVLDFGVARVTGDDVQRTIAVTSVGQLVGTLSYMSPEQVEGDPARVDTRTDVYALGVVLYELLAGRPPHDTARRSVPDAVRAIREEDPTPLSSFERVFRGDIETIVAKALEKDRDRRYPSVDALAEDLRRYLRNEPIVARPPSTFYQLRKFAARNRPLVAGVGAAFVVLVIAVIATSWQAAEAMRERALARDEQQTAEAVNLFLNNLLSSIQPDREAGPVATVRELLDQAAPEIDVAFADRPKVRAALHQTVGATYLALGVNDVAGEHAAQSLALHREVLGPRHPHTIDAMLLMARYLRAHDQKPEAERMLQDALRISREVRPADAPETLDIASELGAVWFEMGPERAGDAERILRETAARQRALMAGAEGRAGVGDVIETLTRLAQLLERAGRVADAEPVHREAYETALRSFGPDNAATITAANNYAICLRTQRRSGDAEPLYRAALDGAMRLYGPDHPQTRRIRHNVAILLQDQQRFAEAETELRSLLEAHRRIHGDDHDTTLRSISALAVVLIRQDRFEEAEPLCREAFETRRRVNGADFDLTLLAQSALAHALTRLGRHAEAETLYTDLIETARRTLPEGHWHLGTYLLGLARLLEAAGRPGEAENLVLEAHGIFQSALGPSHARTIEAAEALAALYETLGRPDDADAWRSRLAESRPAGG